MYKIKSFIRNHKKWSAAGFVCLLCVGSALAYYVASGSGTATGKASATAPSVTLTGSVAKEIGPGGSSGVSLSATNSSGSNVFVGTVAGTVTVDATHETAGCDPSWFSFTGAAENVSVAPGTHALPHDGTLTFNNVESDQGACKGATLTVDLTS